MPLSVYLSQEPTPVALIWYVWFKFDGNHVLLILLSESGIYDYNLQTDVDSKRIKNG